MKIINLQGIWIIYLVFIKSKTCSIIVTNLNTFFKSLASFLIALWVHSIHSFVCTHKIIWVPAGQILIQIEIEEFYEIFPGVFGFHLHRTRVTVGLNGILRAFLCVYWAQTVLFSRGSPADRICFEQSYRKHETHIVCSVSFFIKSYGFRGNWTKVIWWDRAETCIFSNQQWWLEQDCNSYENRTHRLSSLESAKIRCISLF